MNVLFGVRRKNDDRPSGTNYPAKASSNRSVLMKTR